MKTFLCYLLSFQLYVLSFSSITRAQGPEPTPPPSPTTTPVPTPTVDPTPQATPAPQATPCRRGYDCPGQDYSESREGSTKKARAFEITALTVSSMLMIASVAVGLFWVTMFSHIDSLIFFLTSLMFIVMEVINWGKYRKASDHQARIYKDQEFGKQEDAFMRAYNQTKKAQDAAQERANNTMTVAIGFTIAAVIAIILGIIALIPVCGCADLDDAKGTENKTLAAAVKGIATTIGIVALPILALFILVAKGVEETVGNLRESIQKFGIVRGIYYLVFAALAFAVYAMIKEAVDIYKERAKQYMRLYQKLQSMKAKALTPAAMKRVETEFLERVQKLEKRQEVHKKCVTGNRPDTAHWDNKCACVQTRTCKKSEFPDIAIEGFDTPGVINETLAGMNSLGNNLYSGNTAGAKTAQESVNKNANAVRKVARGLMDMYNQKAQEHGYEQVDFDKEVENLKASIMKDLNNGYNSLSSAQKSQLDSFLSGGAIEGEGAAKVEKVANAPTFQKAKVKVPFVPKKNRKKPNFSFKLAEEHTKKEDFAEGMKGYELDSNNTDIDGDDGKNLFEMIHMRYLRSYDKLLETE